MIERPFGEPWKKEDSPEKKRGTRIANPEVLRENGLAGSTLPSDQSRWLPQGWRELMADGRGFNTESEVNPGPHRGRESLWGFDKRP